MPAGSGPQTPGDRGCRPYKGAATLIAAWAEVPTLAIQQQRSIVLRLDYIHYQHMAKKTVVVWANCQGEPLANALRSMHPESFNVHCFMNYEFIKNGLELPAFMKSADLFLYQNYRPKEISLYDLDWIARNILPAHCLKISFPTLHSMPLQFCHDYHEPNNNKTQGPGFPHGEFFFGIKPLADYFVDLVKDSTTKEERILRVPEAVEHALATDFISVSDVGYHKEKSLGFLREKSLKSDTPGIYDYVLDNYRSTRLWHNPNHPNGILLNELCRQVFEAIGLHYNPNPTFLSYIDEYLKDWVIPILPSVQAAIGLEAGSYCESKYHPEIDSTEAYLSKYLRCLYV